MTDNDDLLSKNCLTIIEFISDLRNNILTEPQEQGDLLLVEFFFKKMHPLHLMNHSVDHILPYEKQIEGKNLDFFIQEKNSIFGGLPQKRVDALADMIIEGKISGENQDVIWSYMQTLAAIAKVYKKDK